MKRNIMFLLFVTIVAGRVFASDTTITVTHNSLYLTSTSPVELTATLHPDGFSTTIYWHRELSPGVWSDILGTGPQFLITNFIGSEATFRAFIRKNGTNYFSNKVCIHQLSVVALNPLTITSGGTTPDGYVVLKFDSTDYEHVLLQVSLDNQLSWGYVDEVTNMTSYVGSEKISGTRFYRLEGITADGSKQYSQKAYMVKRMISELIKFQQPFRSTVFNTAGQLIRVIPRMTSRDESDAYTKSVIGLTDLYYRVVCEQNRHVMPLGRVVLR